MFRDSKVLFIEKCYELYEKKMYYLALKIVNDEMAAEDSVHNAFIKLIEGKVIFPDPESDECKRYIITVTKNAAIDVYRKKKRESERLYLIGEEVPDNALNHGDWIGLDISERYLETLPDKYQSVVKCMAIDEMSTKETSKELGISEATVRKRYERARKMLRVMMEQEVDR